MTPPLRTLALASLLAFGPSACGRDPEAPPEIAWDHVACDHCGMLVGDPQTASVLVERGGKERFFDDPGCLFKYVMEKVPAVERMWFHNGDRWYRESEVAFEHGHATPMNYGWWAVPLGTPGSVSLGEASSRVVSP